MIDKPRWSREPGHVNSGEGNIRAHDLGSNDTRPDLTVIGLGEMGSALAGAFLDGGHTTTVWIRTAAKVDALVAKGARRAVTVRDAVVAGPLVIVSVTPRPSRLWR